VVEAMDEEYTLKPLKLLGMMLRNPRVLLHSGRMMRNSQRAAENAAVVVRSILRWI